jgi:hypothetical protein
MNLAVLMVIAVTGITGDFNSDGYVGLADLELFVADWLDSTPDIDTAAVDMDSSGTVDMADFALFAAEWNKGYKPPDDTDSEVAITTHLISRFTLSAISNGGGALSYIVTSLPVKGHLRDVNCDLITTTPYTLKTNELCYETVSATNDSFTWKVNDGTGDSDGATCTLTVTAHPKDHLSFGKDGIVTIADCNEFDLIGNRGIALFIRTFADDCNLLSKVETGVGGWDLSLVSGRPTIRLYDSSGVVDTVPYPDRINDGQWYNLGFAYDPNATDNKIWLSTNDNATGWIDVTEADYSNDADLTVGNGFWWDIDNIRSYTFTAYDNRFYNWGGFTNISAQGFIQTRQDAGDGNEAFGIVIHPTASVRFHCNYDGTNNTATQIYDDLTNHYTGAINSKRYVRYYPYFMEPCDGE